ncbi:SubName: Full=Uncharacterized protein {ECO:0000313/EMBL:CCA71640.1} [Serendipita indica DSM 11827]|nr:SubName: Full=Uncharacterized protein {ECO:0000313/EMBL:CCA71640.1} [Serendipita indica DSM 11827]
MSYGNGALMAIPSTAQGTNPASSCDAPLSSIEVALPPCFAPLDSSNSPNPPLLTVSPLHLQQKTVPSAFKLGNTDVYLDERHPFASKRFTSQRVQRMSVNQTPESRQENSNVTSPASSASSESQNMDPSSPTDANPFSLPTLFTTPFTPTIPPELRTHHEAILRLFLRPHVSIAEYKKAVKPFYVNTKKQRIINGQESTFTSKRCLLCCHTLDHAIQAYQHILEHFGIYPFRCKHSGCEFSSTRSADLTKHVKEQHESNPGHKCSECGAVIRHQRNLKRHKERHHASSP